MTTTEDEIYIPSPELVSTLADRVTAEYGPGARLAEIATLSDEWPETENLDDGQIEELFEEVRDELAARDNGRRR